MTSRKAHATLLFAALLAAGFGVAARAGAAGAGAAPESPPPEQDGAGESPSGDDAPGEPAPAAPESRRGELPPGVTLLEPGGRARLDAAMFPEGVTVLRTARDAPGRRQASLIVVRRAGPAPLEPAPPGPERREGAVDEALAPPPGDALPESATIGPGLGEQLDAFGEAAWSGGAPVAGGSAWVPVPAWPDADPAEPYPWNPVTWSEPPASSTWTPRSAWPRRDPTDPYPWNPASWSTTGIDASWTPRDAWNRTLGSGSPDAGAE